MVGYSRFSNEYCIWDGSDVVKARTIQRMKSDLRWHRDSLEKISMDVHSKRPTEMAPARPTQQAEQYQRAEQQARDRGAEAAACAPGAVSSADREGAGGGGEGPGARAGGAAGAAADGGLWRAPEGLRLGEGCAFCAMVIRWGSVGIARWGDSR